MNWIVSALSLVTFFISFSRVLEKKKIGGFLHKIFG